MKSLISKDTKVLLQLSGGKDSIACMIYLKEHSMEFEAIHFVHKYGYSLPTAMAKKACEEFHVKLNIIDVTNEIGSLFLNGYDGRPCRYCKGIMDKVTVNYAQANGFQLICVGDTKDDQTLINRLVKYEGMVNNISRYFNQSVPIPDDIAIFRPLLEYNSDETLDLVLHRLPWFKRVHDTGDKYFEYSREGCPLQFKDYGVVYTKELMEKLQYLNMLCGQFATQKGIRASIHLPSEFIVTIPKGYEDECWHYLQSHGANLKPIHLKKILRYSFFIDLNLNSAMCSANIIKIACERLIERLSITGDFVFSDRMGYLATDEVKVDIFWDTNDRLLVSITSLEMKYNKSQIENLCMEIFHTREFVVLNYQK